MKHNIYLFDPKTKTFSSVLAISTSRIVSVSCITFILSSLMLFQRSVSTGHAVLWTILLASTLLLLYIHSEICPSLSVKNLHPSG